MNDDLQGAPLGIHILWARKSIGHPLLRKAASVSELERLSRLLPPSEVNHRTHVPVAPGQTPYWDLSEIWIWCGKKRKSTQNGFVAHQALGLAPGFRTCRFLWPSVLGRGDRLQFRTPSLSTRLSEASDWFRACYYRSSIGSEVSTFEPVLQTAKIVVSAAAGESRFNKVPVRLNRDAIS